MGYPGGSTGTAGKLTFDEPTLFNTTLIGEKVLAKEVVCRTMWGTPMLPNDKAGYSIIAAIKPALIAESNIIPPLTNGPIYRPSVAVVKVVTTTTTIPAPAK